GRARVDPPLAQLPTSWTIPVAFAALITSTAPKDTTPANAATTVTVDARPHTYVENLSYRQELPTTTTTTTASPLPAPVVNPVTTTAPPAPAPKPVAAPPKPVPTTAPPQSTTTGEASWYGAPAGTCASPTLAFGTVVTVTDLSTGAAVRCTVDDREAHTPGRVLDLAPATFSQLASLSVGVIEVRLSW
ncbi:MAG: septal ring lytic transglycosylase RlpA family protein, partial [Streptosporangiaceae bacterium]